MWPHSSSVLLAGLVLVTLLGHSALHTLTLPPHLRHLLRHAHLHHEKQFEGFPLRRPLKRTTITAHGGGALLSRSLRQVENDVMGRYILVPRPIIGTTRMLQEGVNCSAYRVTHQNHFGEEGRLGPTWLHNSTMIGVCPTKYVSRLLPGPQKHRPSEVLEAQCICNNSQCSNDGAICVALKYRMPVLKISQDGDYYTEVVEDLTLACVCAKNPSLDGGFIPSPAEES